MAFLAPARDGSTHGAEHLQSVSRGWSGLTGRWMPWWSMSGEIRMAAHKCNHLRVPYIRDAACRHWSRDASRADCLKGASYP